MIGIDAFMEIDLPEARDLADMTGTSEASLELSGKTQHAF